MLLTALAVVHDPDSARDIVHDIFAGLLNQGSNIDVDGNYLLKSARNRALNHIRNLDLRERLNGLFMLESDKEVSVCSNGEGDLPDYDRVMRCIQEHIPEKSREVLRLRFFENQKYAEIADRLNISEVAVYKHLRRAVDILRKELTEDFL